MNWAAIRLWVWVLAFAAVDVAASAWADEPVAPAVQPDSAQPAREPVYYGRTSSEWLRLLASGNDRDRAYAVYALERLVPDSPDAARAIAGAVQDLNRDVSVRASETLVRLGPKAQAATSILAAALVDRASEVRERAMAPLDAIGWDKVAVTGLAAAIDDRDTQVSRGAAYKAIGLGRKAEKAAPSLVRALKSPDVEVRYLAAIALVEATPDAKAALPVLIEAARNPVWTIQIEDVPCGGSSRHLVAGTDALRALGKLGPAAKDAIPLFADLLTRPETQSVNPPQSPTILPADGRGAYVSNVRRLASEALAAAGIESLPHLEKALSNSNRDVRALAAAAIGKLGPAASHAAGALVDRLDRDDAQARSMGPFKLPEAELAPEIVEALGKLGPDARPAIPKLERLLAKKDAPAFVHVAAASSMWRLDKSVKSLPVLLKILKAPSEHDDDASNGYLYRDAGHLFTAVADVIGEMGPAAASAAPALKEIAQDPKFRPAQRVAAAYAWFRVAKASEAIDVLADIATPMTDRVAGVIEAIDRLRQLGPDAKPAFDTLVAQLKTGPWASIDNRDTRTEIYAALLAIDPVAARKAGIKPVSSRPAATTTEARGRYEARGR